MPEHVHIVPELLPRPRPAPPRRQEVRPLIITIRLELSVRSVPDGPRLPASTLCRQAPPPPDVWQHPTEKENEMTRTLSLSAFMMAASLAAAMPAFAEDEHNVSTGITVVGSPLGLHGADPVALTTLNAVAEGSAEFTVVEDGVAYYFASKASADQFKADPAKYTPQYGGFCAYAVALGKKLDGDPQYADIVDGKLYLFVNAEIFEKYKKDSKSILAKAEKTWPRIEHKAVSDL